MTTQTYRATCPEHPTGDSKHIRVGLDPDPVRAVRDLLGTLESAAHDALKSSAEAYFSIRLEHITLTGRGDIDGIEGGDVAYVATRDSYGDVAWNPGGPVATEGGAA